MTSSPPKSRRATPMAPDERRRAIVEVVLPLLLQHGAAVTTKQIAEAAGIAEGTIFRVFPDKAALLHAAAEDTLNPPDGRERFAALLEGVTDLRGRVLLVTGYLNERSEEVMAVMMALRAAALASPMPGDSGPHPERVGPPQYVLDAQQTLIERLTEVFEPYAAVLSVPPRTAALLLRALVLGVRHPGALADDDLSAHDIASALLDGIATPGVDLARALGAGTLAQEVR